jgi:dTDP-4-amino-4,6-dideoxygalactose transaminase
MIQRAEIVREKGTNRSLFWRGQVDKYTWVDIGSSFLPSELNAAYLYPQLEHAEMINQNRLASWNLYAELLYDLAANGRIEPPFIPENCEHNAHMFYIKTADLGERTKLIQFLRENGVESVFHYVPLHSSPAGLRFGRFHGEDRFTTSESERLLRLPMYYNLTEADIETVTRQIIQFYKQV